MKHVSKKLAGLTKKFICLFCDGEASLEHYKTKASAEELEALLILWKVCRHHTDELTEVMNRKAIERTVA